MVGVGEPIYNTEQRREMLRQLKEHLDNEWLKIKAEPIKKKLKKKKKNKDKKKKKSKIV